MSASPKSTSDRLQAPLQNHAVDLGDSDLIRLVLYQSLRLTLVSIFVVALLALVPSIRIGDDRPVPLED